MKFGDPYLILAAIAAAIIAIGLRLIFLKKRFDVIAYSDLGLVKDIKNRRNIWLWLSYFCLGSGLLFLILAAGQPLLAQSFLKTVIEGRDIVIIMDYSYSMDFPTQKRRGEFYAKENTKSWVAEQAVLRFIKERPEGDRVSLIIFGDEAYHLNPLSRDKKSITFYLEEQSQKTDGKYLGGTNLFKPLEMGIKDLREMGQAKEKVIIMFSDGDAFISLEQQTDLVSQIIKLKIRFYFIGVDMSNAGDLTSVVEQSNSKLFLVETEELSKAFLEINLLEKSAIKTVNAATDVNAVKDFLTAGLIFWALCFVLLFKV